MNISNINYVFKEYNSINGKWKLIAATNGVTDSRTISQITEAGVYFNNMGGKQYVTCKHLRKLGMQVIKITCISSCKSVMRLYEFSYNNARYVS